MLRCCCCCCYKLAYNNKKSTTLYYITFFQFNIAFLCLIMLLAASAVQDQRLYIIVARSCCTLGTAANLLIRLQFYRASEGLLIIKLFCLYLCLPACLATVYCQASIATNSSALTATGRRSKAATTTTTKRVRRSIQSVH